MFCIKVVCNSFKKRFSQVRVCTLAIFCSQIDALESSHPISIEVKHPDEINEIFDRISYAKGASILRMIDNFLTRKSVKQGLTNYLKAL